MAFERMNRGVFVVLSGLAFALNGVTAAGQCQVSKLTASDAAAGDEFGEGVAVSGDYAVVGARQWASGDVGAAYVFLRQAGGWVEQAKLVASDGAATDQFGRSVAIDGDTVVVGATHDDDGGSGSGSAYVFRRTGATWTQEAKLTAGDAAAGDAFGVSVGVSGDHAVVGAISDDDAGPSSGSAYVFVRSGTVWTQQAKLTAADAAAGDNFGLSAAISGDTAIAGAYFDDDAGSGSGSAYVFRRSGTAWSQEQKLTASDASSGARFGTSVSIDGDSVVVGSDGARAAYVFTRSVATWTEQAKLVGSGPGVQVFGNSVSISGDTVVVGDEGDSQSASFSGAAYVFSRSGVIWTEDAKLKALDVGANDFFGHSVAVNAGHVVVGADGNSDAGNSSGSAYVFQSVVVNDCNHNGVEDLCDIEAGTSPDCNGNAIPDECDVILSVRLFGADFEFGLPILWSATGLWHVTAQCAVAGACDPVQWAYFGQGATCDFSTGAPVAGSLTTFAFPIPGNATSAWLTYCSVYDGDRGIAPTGFDSAWVEAAGVIVDDVGPSAVPGVWEERTVNLSPFIGSNLTLSWNFDSIDAIGNNSLGWQVDNIEVTFARVDNDCNANGIPDECDPDCNTNGVADDCDIAAGTSPDCDTNGVPDECDPDFDGDGLIDACDPDIDDDGVPNAADVCDFTPAGAIIEPDGGVLGDIDGDCDVDLTDYAIMQLRFTGPNG